MTATENTYETSRDSFYAENMNNLPERSRNATPADIARAEEKIAARDPKDICPVCDRYKCRWHRR